MVVVQALPDDKKPLSAELFWLAFRLHAGLPLNPRDVHAGEGSPHGGTDAISDIFRRDGDCDRNRGMALLVLCSFAEGGYNRPKTKKNKVIREPAQLLVSPTFRITGFFVFRACSVERPVDDDPSVAVLWMMLPSCL